jgi:hypothetical protein
MVLQYLLRTGTRNEKSFRMRSSVAVILAAKQLSIY